jgi:hypothetical protein
MVRMGSLFVVSDVHGFRQDLERGLAEVGFSGDDELWVLGDLLDRGPDGIGAIDHVRALQHQAPARVHALMGNHEILALGRHRFPDSRFDDSWRINGGLQSDQDALTEEHVAWLATLPLLARVQDHLFMHSDTTEYLRWGSTVDEVNSTVRAALADAEDFGAHWEVWKRLTTRYHFAGDDGPAVAQRMLGRYGGRRIVHGHSIIGSLLDRPSPEVTEPLLYAEGHVLDIDGGRYDDGPLLIVELA